MLLALAALALAQLGDIAQRTFDHLARVHRYVPLLLCPLGFVAIAYLTQRLAPDAVGSGIPQVIAATRDPNRATRSPLVSLRTALAKFVLTLGMLLCGGSVGREGPTVQIGAAVMVAVHKRLRVAISSGVLIAGGAAGVAAAFNTPLAGVAFAIEELAAAYEQRVALIVMGAVMIAGFVSLGIAGDYVYFGVAGQLVSFQGGLSAAPVAGIVGGVLGGLFARGLLRAPAHIERRIGHLQHWRLWLAGGCGLVIAVSGLATAGATWGTGYEATRTLMSGGDVGWSFGPLKFLATLATGLSGTPGGIFAPSLAVGAGLGQLLSALFTSQPAGAIILLGMAGYFVGVVRAPLTAVIIITETTASRGMIVPLFMTALIADAVSAAVHRERLYHALSKGFLSSSAPAKSNEPAPPR